MAERIHHASTLACEKYNSGEDFDVWVELFERAVSVAHQLEDGDVKDNLCKKWLPLKLDESALTSFQGVDPALTWPDLKAKLSEVLADPLEKYDWHAGKDAIVWDGKESFHALATRVIRKVKRNAVGTGRRTDCFLRFHGTAE